MWVVFDSYVYINADLAKEITLLGGNHGEISGGDLLFVVQILS